MSFGTHLKEVKTGIYKGKKQAESMYRTLMFSEYFSAPSTAWIVQRSLRGKTQSRTTLLIIMDSAIVFQSAEEKHIFCKTPWRWDLVSGNIDYRLENGLKFMENIIEIRGIKPQISLGTK